ncbi:MAG: helix-turn-helix domain-containing protein [Solirubrobacterales bacterium]
MLPQKYVAAHKQTRIMHALAELTAEQGYEATKISDIVKRAGVARKTLYDNFGGKEEVFTQAFDAALNEAIDRIEASCSTRGDRWDDAVEAALTSLLDYVAEEPKLAALCLIEAPAATSTTMEHYDEAMGRIVDLVRGSLPLDKDVAETAAAAVAGGVARVIYQQVCRGETVPAQELAVELSSWVMAISSDVAR